MVDYQTNYSFSTWGGFNSWWLFATSGTQYANGEGSPFNSGDTSKRGFVAEGDLHYTLFSNPSHTLYGQLDTLKLGAGLQGVTPRNLADEKFTITGLNLSSNASEGRDGIVHKIIYGLMKPNKEEDTDGTQHLENYLKNKKTIIKGNFHNNYIQGYNNNDVLIGGGGNNYFIFSISNKTGSFGDDTIIDFNPKKDKIIIKNTHKKTTSYIIKCFQQATVIKVLKNKKNIGSITLIGKHNKNLINVIQIEK